MCRNILSCLSWVKIYKWYLALAFFIFNYIFWMDCFSKDYIGCKKQNPIIEAETIRTVYWCRNRKAQREGRLPHSPAGTLGPYFTVCSDLLCSMSVSSWLASSMLLMWPPTSMSFMLPHSYLLWVVGEGVRKLEKKNLLLRTIK